MNFIKARFVRDGVPSGRAYTYRIDNDVKHGEFVMDFKGSKLIVVDEPVDMEWVEFYGAEKVAIVKKYEEPAVAGGSEE